MEERNITVEGLRIRYLEEGSGPVVLLLHGGTLGFSADMWLKNIGPLANEGYRIIAYDQPGFGHSDAPPDFGLRYRQDFIVKFLGSLGVERATLVGHSQAGGLVIGAALETPQRFPGMVVLGTGSLLPPLEKGSRDVDPPMKEPEIEDTRALLKATLFDHSLITPQILADYHAMSIGRNFTNAVKRAEAAAAQGRGPGKPLWQRLGEVTIPSFYIYGANDRGNAAERVVMARERYPDLTFHLLDRCHHIVQWDRAKDADRLILGFLDRLKASGALAQDALTVTE
jgi:pimeloyl-ACP methyl ester carboxylesterase